MMVDFTLVVTEKTSYAENLRVRPFVSLENDPQGAGRIAMLEKALSKDPSSKSTLAVGQHVPDFSLTDQNRQQVALSQFSGKVVAMTFVYTRCPLPNFCFRLSNNFGQLQKRFGKQMGHDLILLTVTLDPIHDQPDALRQIRQHLESERRILASCTGCTSRHTKGDRHVRSGLQSRRGNDDAFAPHGPHRSAGKSGWRTSKGTNSPRNNSAIWWKPY